MSLVFLRLGLCVFSSCFYFVGEGRTAVRALCKEPVARSRDEGLPHPPHHAPPPPRPSSPFRHALMQPCNSMKCWCETDRRQHTLKRTHCMCTMQVSPNREPSEASWARGDGAPWAPPRPQPAPPTHPPRPAVDLSHPGALSPRHLWPAAAQGLVARPFLNIDAEAISIQGVHRLHKPRV